MLEVSCKGKRKISKDRCLVSALFISVFLSQHKFEDRNKIIAEICSCLHRFGSYGNKKINVLDVGLYCWYTGHKIKLQDNI